MEKLVALLVWMAAGAAAVAQPGNPAPKADKLPVLGWTIKDEKDPLTDVAVLVAALPSIADRAGFVMRCSNGHISALFMKQFAHFRRGGVEVATRINTDPPAREMWTSVLDGEAVSASAPLQLVRSLPDNGKLFIRAATAFGMPADATFELRSVSIARARIAAACHWTQAP